MIPFPVEPNTAISSRATAVCFFSSVSSFPSSSSDQLGSIAKPRDDDLYFNELLLLHHFPFGANKGGLVIFYHLPKTGGTFIRDTLINANIPIERVFSTKQLLGNKYGERIQKILSGLTTELLVLELHGRFVGIPQLPIRQWRDTALRHNVPFFAFTLLRDPVAFHDSYFAFFHRKGCQQRWCEPMTYDEMSESHLLESLVPNKQCRALVSWSAGTQMECDGGSHGDECTL